MNAVMPDWYIEDLRKLDWRWLYEAGIRHVFLDLDNSLSPQGSVEADERAVACINALRAAGLTGHILSNAGGERARRYAQSLDLPCLGHAGKPLTVKLRRYMDKKEIRPQESLMVGDQIFTDLLCGRFSGMRVLLLEPLKAPEPLWVRIKRRLESLLRRLGFDPTRKPAPGDGTAPLR